MSAYWKLMGILVLFAILIVGPAGNVLGQNQNAPDDRGHFRMGLWTSLTQEQRKALWSTVAEMRDQGASPEEVHSAVAQMLKGYGIELPEHWGKGHRGGWRQFFSNLTNEQRKVVREKMKEMREQGATPEEIHAAVVEMLKGYGIEMPEGAPKASSPSASPEPRIIAQSRPNPFNPETQIKYTLTAPGEVRVKIYNVTGEVVRTFNEGYHLAGSYSLKWNGCDANGNLAASGIYLYRIEAGPYAVTGRMVLLR